MNGPTITVMVAVFNGARTIQRCLDSIAAQTYRPIELIVMDGGSDDGTVAILQSNDSRIAYWESAPDRGISHAWNKALAHASGEWICVLGADDRFWDEHAVERLVVGLPDPSESMVVYGSAAILAPDGRVLRVEGRPWEQVRRDLAWSLPIPHPGLLHHSSLFSEYGEFDESFRIVGDYELLLRVLRDSDARFVPGVITVGFERGGISHSPAAMAQMLAEIDRARRKNNMPRTLRISRTRLKMLVTSAAVRVVGVAGFNRIAEAYRRLRRKPLLAPAAHL